MAVIDFICRLLGFNKKSKYVNKHINEANIRSSIYMSTIIIILEIWMIIRSTNKYVIDAMKTTSWFDAQFTYTSLFILFIIASGAMLIFAISYLRNKFVETTKGKIFAFVGSSLLILYSLFIFKELDGPNFDKWDVSNYYVVSNLGVIFFYLFALLLGLAIMGHTIYQMIFKKNNEIISVVVVIFFAMMCLAFGVKVGYTDFFSKFRYETGLPAKIGYVVNLDDIKNYPSNFEIKSILCFLTMVIFVGCLLIWRPYITIILLTGIFTGFYFLLDSDSLNRVFAEGEKVNYITFLISLIAITISIYQQRYREATKSEELYRLTIYDDLTGIHNFRYFTEASNKLIKDPDINLDNYIYLFINIENFKTYNDKNGFENGNKFLINFAEVVSLTFNDDITARISDDHFAVLTRSLGFEDKIQSLKNFVEEKSNVYLDLKVGGYKPINRDEEPRRSIDRSRFAASTIKKKPDENYFEYSQEMDKQYQKLQYVINNLDQAIENGYIHAFYQPVVWSGTKELCGCEALARWIDPEYGFLSPGDFIPILEDYRLIHKLDKAIFEIVCRDIREALDNEISCVPVSINFSRLDFELMDAIKELDSAVEKYNVPKDYIHVEVTESALTDNLDSLLSTIDKFRQLGYAIWLDDFGSGYSSLNVLKDYDFDVLKIDMKFLSAFDTNPKSKGILTSVIDLASKIGMMTLTEGVETEEEAQFLMEAGCGRLQGYLFGKPMKKEELIEKIKDGTFKISDKIL